MKPGPIYRKDSLGGSRSLGMVILLFATLSVLSLIVILNLYNLQSRVYLGGQIDYAGFLRLYDWMAAALLLLLLLSGPAYAYQSLHREKAEHSLELLLCTALRPVDIIAGKLLAIISNFGLLGLVCMPVLGTVMIYGGITGEEILLLCFVYMGLVVVVGALGLWTAVWFSGQFGAMLFAYGLLGASLALPGAAYYFLLQAWPLWQFVLMMMSVLLSVSALLLHFAVRGLKRSLHRELRLYAGAGGH